MAKNDTQNLMILVAKSLIDVSIVKYLTEWSVLFGKNK